MITILQIGYDKLQIATRASLLVRQGYRVLSALGNGNAFTLASADRVDLVLIGNSAPIGIRENAACLFKDHFPQIPIVALRSGPLSHDVQYADYNGTVEDPEEWLAVIARATSNGHTNAAD